MKYRLVQYEWELFKPKTDAKLLLSISNLNPEERKSKEDYPVSPLFWYAPEIYSEEEALKVFVEGQIELWEKDIEWLKALQAKLMDAYKCKIGKEE